MKISFPQGNDYAVRFRFPKFTGTIEMIYFTVKCINGQKRIQKKLNDGIDTQDEWYVINFVPEDTEELVCNQQMKYDIKIIVNGRRITVAKDFFELKDVVTNFKDEV